METLPTTGSTCSVELEFFPVSISDTIYQELLLQLVAALLAINEDSEKQAFGVTVSSDDRRIA